MNEWRGAGARRQLRRRVRAALGAEDVSLEGFLTSIVSPVNVSVELVRLDASEPPRRPALADGLRDPAAARDLPMSAPPASTGTP